MVEINNQDKYEVYFGGSTMFVILGLIFFTTIGHCNFLISSVIAIIIELLIMLNKFIAKIAITENEIQVTFHRLCRRYITIYDISSSTIKVDQSFSENGPYDVLKIFHQGEIVQKVSTDEGFNKKDLRAFITAFNEAKAVHDFVE